jgi:hypothetical protein
VISGEAAARLNAGIVEDDAEVRVLGSNPIDQRPSAFGVRDVTGSRDQRWLDRLRASQRLCAPAADDDSIATLKKLLRKRQSDAA